MGDDHNKWGQWGKIAYKKGKLLNIETDLDPKKANKVYWEHMVVDLPPLHWHPIKDGKVLIKRNIVSPILTKVKGKVRPISNVYRFEVDATCLYEAIRLE